MAARASPGGAPGAQQAVGEPVPVTAAASTWIKIVRRLVGQGARPLPAAGGSWNPPALCVELAEIIH